MTGEARTAVALEFWDGAAVGSGEDLLGLWAPAAGPEGEAPVWRASYPADPDEAETGLQEVRRKLEAVEAALVEAPVRLEVFAGRQAAGEQLASYGPQAAVPQPESDLALLLQEMRQGAAAASYAAGGKTTGRWDQAVEAVEELIERLKRNLSDYAWVETCAGGRLVAQTRIGWVGDAETVIPVRPDPAQMALHRQTLALALASRQALMRTFTAALEASIKLAAGGPILALPAVWRFINQVRIELQKRGEISNG